MVYDPPLKDIIETGVANALKEIEKFADLTTIGPKSLTMDQKWKIARSIRDEIMYQSQYLSSIQICQSDVYDIANMVKCVDDDIRAGVDKLQRINDYDNESNEKGYVETPKK